MKETDYSIERGIEAITYKRAVKIGNNTGNLCVVLKKNYAKASIEVIPKLTESQITGIEIEDEAILKTLTDLARTARKDGVAWRTEQRQLRREAQDLKNSANGVVPKIGFGEGDQGDAKEEKPKASMKVAGKPETKAPAKKKEKATAKA